MRESTAILLLLMVAGLAFAIAPATDWTVGTPGKFVPDVIANHTTEGGNVTPLNLTSNVSTEKWAGFWGSVSGSLLLSDGVNPFFTWAWDSSRGGEVCAIAAPSGFDWASVATPTVVNIDSVWAFTSTDTDSANNTLISSCGLHVAGSSLSGFGNVTTGGFTTCAIGDGGEAIKADYAFCTNMSAGATLFNGLTGDYELMVPTNETDATTETYYFWLELD